MIKTDSQTSMTHFNKSTAMNKVSAVSQWFSLAVTTAECECVCVVVR